MCVPIVRSNAYNVRIHSYSHKNKPYTKNTLMLIIPSQALIKPFQEFLKLILKRANAFI